MSSNRPVIDPIVDLAAPGADTDILAEDFKPPFEGFQDVTIQVALKEAGKMKLVDKPGPNLIGAKATGQIQAIASSLLVDGDYFTLKDGTNTKLFEFERTKAATGQIQAIAASLLADGDYFTLKDGVHVVLFEIDKQIAAIAATGLLETPATGGAVLLDGETFTLDDGINTPTVFEFNLTGGVTGGRVAIAITGLETQAQLRDLLISAINGVGIGLAITASASTNDVLLTSDNPGAAGNTSSAETVLDAGFVLSDMENGADAVYDGVTGGRTAVELVGGETAAQVASAIMAAVNGVGAGLTMTASINADTTKVDLVNDDDGTIGNIANTENVTNAGFTISGMTGGVGTVGVTGGRVAVTISTTATAAQVAAAIEAAVNGVGSGLLLTATVDEDDDTKVNLENDANGADGNIANTENVTNAGFTVSGMSGGYGGDVTILLDINGAVDLAAESIYQKSFKLHSERRYNLQITVDGIVRQLYISASK